MHRTAALSLAAMLAWPALVGAQQPSSPPPTSPPPAAQPSASGTPSGSSVQIDASSIIGSTVRTHDGKDIGKVSRLMVDPRDGRVTTVVVGMGGTLGVGEKLVSVPWHGVRIGQDNQKVVVTLDQQILDQAPSASPATSGSK